ncbi:glutaminyl-peptide cyclotransferase [Ichthyenterobacterium sp. W332]|uniref:Glutaminyl-peptide cyclotransferase n=1 Tax=Microcosmobacter mediterraneus TaxID=3075607 RepID=A0ABU2YIH9_9FLAO|nr:glutaminyl-peptide cyclotransferase [Ichthyenterobacterium sp. W332]MDT0557580.1 glutaminyl-peptide cyclotransferase [Ichthyenterobacterium sp. W332]
MQVFKLLFSFVLVISLVSCGSGTAEKASKLSIKTNAIKGEIILGESLTFSLNNPENLEIDSVSFSINGQSITSPFTLSDVKLGKQNLVATVSFDNNSKDVTKSITILNNIKPKVYGFDIINEYPHDITSYTQGLEFYNGVLYESTGQYGESKLRKLDYKTGEVLQSIDLAKTYFGEGLTILNDKIYQLTWQENTGFVYDVNNFNKESSFKYGNSKEGWGICNDGSLLYKSDGTEKIWTLNSSTLTEEGNIQVYTDKGKIPQLNELEWINGKIYANIYQKNGVVIVNPNNGAVEVVIDFSSLKDKVTQHKGLDVLNGIAYNPETKTIFVTGKRWDKLFEVKITE